jgi:hypothetical protein
MEDLIGVMTSEGSAKSTLLMQDVSTQQYSMSSPYLVRVELEFSIFSLTCSSSTLYVSESHLVMIGIPSA